MAGSDLWPITVAARRSLLGTFEQLTDEQWDAPSLCDGWTVRHVLSHLILAVRPPLRRYAVTAVRTRRNFDTVNSDLAIADAAQPTDVLLNTFRDVVEHRFAPPGWPAAAPLSDILLHTLDVRVPLGLPTDEPPAHYEHAMKLLLGRAGRSFTRSGRPAVSWTGTDHGWAHGTGPAVAGAMADLALAAAGRNARLDDLSGDGVAALKNWLGPAE